MDYITNLRDMIVTCCGILGEHAFLINKKMKEMGVDPLYAANGKHVETTNI